MSCKTLAQDITQAISTTTTQSSDLFVFARNGQAYNIPFQSLTTQLGVTGCIKSRGSPTSVSVLNQPATGYNYIRGLEPSQGITAAITPQGGVSVKTNFVNAVGDAQIVQDTTAAQIKFRSISAGDGIQVGVSDDGEAINISTTTATTSTNTVIVNTIDDFPPASSGVITLEGDTNYFVASNISTANRFVFGSGTVISSGDGYGTTLTYTGADDMFTFVNGLSGIKEIGIRCANGTMLNTDAVTSGNLLLRWLLIREVKNLGTIKAPSTGIYDCFISLHTGQGFQCGTASNFRLNISSITVASTTSATSKFLDVGTAMFTSLNIDKIIFLATVTGQFFLSGAAAGANLNSGVIGFVSQNTITGDMAGLETITNNDAGWDFTDNNKIGDTRPIALMIMAAPATTVITTISTPVLVSGSFTDQESSLFTISAAGRVTYTGNRPLSADLTASITFQSASATNTFEFYLAKNGVPILASGVSREVSASTTANISLLWDLPIEENDYLELWVANITGTNNVDAVKIVARIK